MELMLRCAELDESRLNNLHRAEQAYRAALQLQPQCLPAIQGLRRVLARRGRRRLRPRCCWRARPASRGIRAAPSRPSSPRPGSPRARCRTRRAPSRLYRQALEKDPLDAQATAGLEDLLAARGGAADLATLQERRGEARLAQRDTASAAAAFFGAAKTHLSALNDRARALELLERTLSLQPAHPEALELRANLLLEDRQLRRGRRGARPARSSSGASRPTWRSCTSPWARSTRTTCPSRAARPSTCTPRARACRATPRCWSAWPPSSSRCATGRARWTACGGCWRWSSPWPSARATP